MTGRGLHGRRTAQVILAVVIALDVFLVLFVSAAGTNSGPMFIEPPSPWFGWLILAVGFALHAVGLTWMIWIIRTDPEAHPSFWRSARS